MAALELLPREDLRELDPSPRLHLVPSQDTPRDLKFGRSLAQRREMRSRMMRRRRRSLVIALLLGGLYILAQSGPAFGGVTGSGPPTDLADSSVLASGMNYIVQPGDTVHSIAKAMNPVDPKTARTELESTLGSQVVVPGEHILIP